MEALKRDRGAICHPLGVVRVEKSLVIIFAVDAVKDSAGHERQHHQATESGALRQVAGLCAFGVGVSVRFRV